MRSGQGTGDGGQGLGPRGGALRVVFDTADGTASVRRLGR
jgi:hypothetical protein